MKNVEGQKNAAQAPLVPAGDPQVLDRGTPPDGGVAGTNFKHFNRTLAPRGVNRAEVRTTGPWDGQTTAAELKAPNHPGKSGKR